MWWKWLWAGPLVINAVDKNSLHEITTINSEQLRLNNEQHINDGGESVNIYGYVNGVQDEKPDLIWHKINGEQTLVDASSRDKLNGTQLEPGNENKYLRGN